MREAVWSAIPAGIPSAVKPWDPAGQIEKSR